MVEHVPPYPLQVTLKGMEKALEGTSVQEIQAKVMEALHGAQGR